jgi:hypothetical protein
MDRELLWKVIPWKRGLDSKQVALLIRSLEDSGYSIEVTTIEDKDNGCMACLLVYGEGKSAQL